MKMKHAALGVLSAAAFSLPSLAMAQMKGDSHWYIGGGIGQADVKEISDEDTSMKIFGGYQINRTWAVELGYTDFGKVSAGGAEFSSNAWELVGVGTLPLGDGKFGLFGKAGFFWGEAKGGGVKDDSVELTYGVGAAWNFTPNLALRGEYQRYTDVGNGASDVDVLGINVVYRFK
jgi:OmpA-OmpF porin, OOP family